MPTLLLAALGTSPSPNGPLAHFLRDPSATLHHLGHVLAHLAVMAATHVVPPLLGAVVLIVVLRALARRLGARRAPDDIAYLEVLPPPSVERAGAAAFWANVHGLLGRGHLFSARPQVAFEIGIAGEQVRFGLVAPRAEATHLARAVAAAWPGATAVPLATADWWSSGTALAGQELRFRRQSWYPIATEHDLDPLRAVLGAAAELTEDEHALVQMVCRPAPRRISAKAERAVLGLQGIAAPGPVQSVLGPVARTILDAITTLLTPGTSSSARRTPRPVTAAPPGLKAAREKLAHQCFEVVVRIGISSSEIDRLAERRLQGRLRGLSAAFSGYAGDNALVPRRLGHGGTVLSRRELRRGDLYSTPELAALAHLPLDRDVPGLARAGARTVTPPPATPRDGKVLGHAEGGIRRPVALSPLDATHHLHLLGATGSGKSTLLLRLVLSGVEAHRGAVVIDPKGDLVTDILDRLPEKAAERVVVIDPEDDAPPALNVLAGADTHLVVDQVTGIMGRLFASAWGPRTDDVCRAALLTLRHHRGAHLGEVPRLLTDPLYRAPLVAAVGDPVLAGFWRQYEGMSEAARAAVIAPLTNKLRACLLRPFARAVIGSGTSSFSLDRVLGGGLLLCRLPKGILGDESVRLMGSLLVAQVWQVAAARARAGQRRALSSLYLDECQNFLGLPGSVADLLAEARGYGLSLVLAHQTLGQLGDDLAEAVSANARTKLYFNCSPEDARRLERHVAPELAAHGLSHLGAYQVACRLVVGGEERSAFTLRTESPPPVAPGRAALVRQCSRKHYGRSDAERRALALAVAGGAGGESADAGTQRNSRSWGGRSPADSPDVAPDGFNLPGLSRRADAGGGAA
ncbi:MAG: type IV secretion system DNA-binding domain-containing protein [Actinomycetota bacterium]|nr:type IV secretion system DNA-binding domain-containing protein [Actinomycetota bacterium]